MTVRTRRFVPLLLGTLLLVVVGCGRVTASRPGAPQAQGKVAMTATQPPAEGPEAVTPAPSVPAPQATPPVTAEAVSAPEVAPTAQPTPTRVPTLITLPGQGEFELVGRIAIPALGLTHQVVSVSWRMEQVDGRPVAVWDTVKGAVGHHRGSAPLGEVGNTVLTGHTRGDGLGEFQGIQDLARGAEIHLWDDEGRLYPYQVESVMTLQEVGLTLEERQQNAAVMAATDDTRVTLITCWPEWAYTHRVIVVAKPQ